MLSKLVHPRHPLHLQVTGWFHIKLTFWLIFYFDQTSQSQEKTSPDQNTKLTAMSTVYSSELCTRKYQRNEKKEGNKEERMKRIIYESCCILLHLLTKYLNVQSKQTQTIQFHTAFKIWYMSKFHQDDIISFY